MPHPAPLAHPASSWSPEGHFLIFQKHFTATFSKEPFVRLVHQQKWVVPSLCWNLHHPFFLPTVIDHLGTAEVLYVIRSGFSIRYTILSSSLSWSGNMHLHHHFSKNNIFSQAEGKPWYIKNFQNRYINGWLFRFVTKHWFSIYQAPIMPNIGAGHWSSKVGNTQSLPLESIF